MPSDAGASRWYTSGPCGGVAERLNATVLKTVVGGVAEWSIAPVLKTGNGQPFVSSNLTASANKNKCLAYLGGYAESL